MIYFLLGFLMFGPQIKTHLQDTTFPKYKKENPQFENCFLVKETNKYKCEAKNG